MTALFVAVPFAASGVTCATLLVLDACTLFFCDDFFLVAAIFIAGICMSGIGTNDAADAGTASSASALAATINLVFTDLTPHSEAARTGFLISVRF